MKYYGEINPHKFDGDWHPDPPEENDFIDGNYHNHGCENNQYKDLMLTNLVKAQIVKSLKIELSRYNSKKSIHLSKDDKIEIIYLNQLELTYKFGRVKDFDTNRICLDCSDDCTSEIIHVSLSDIRDIEIYYGVFVLKPNKCENDYTNNGYNKEDHNCNISFISSKYYTQEDVDILLSWLGSTEDHS